MQSYKLSKIKKKITLTFIGVFTVLTITACQSVLTNKEKENTAKDLDNIVIDYNQVKTINRVTDPSYVIEYKNSKFVPPDGKVLYIGGQEKHDIPQFINGTGIVPGGLASYAAVSSDASITYNSPDIGGGIQNIAYLVEEYPNTAMQIAYWMVGKWYITDNTIAGKYDKHIDYFISWVKSVDVPVYFRIGYEFDGLHNELEPDKYILAYRYIVDRMRSKGVTNVAFVWHSYAAAPYKGYDVMDWYPGDEYVDWFAVSIFSHFYGKAAPQYYLDRFVDLAKQHKKPVMIAESQPAGNGIGIIPNSYETWNNWFVNTFNYIHEKNIKAFSYISADTDAYPMHAFLKWGDSRIHKYPLINKLWIEEISKDKYLKSSESLFKELGYK